MKLTISKQALSTALGKVKASSDAKSTVPILGNFLLDAQDRLSITASNISTRATAIVDANISHTGITTVSAQKLFDIVKNASDGDISLEQKDDYLIVKQGRSRFKLPTLPHDSFPAPSKQDGAVSFTIHGAILHGLISGVTHAMKTDQVLEYLCGVYLHTKNGTLTASATDGHRLAVSNDDFQSPEFGSIVPDKACRDICKLIESGAGDISVIVSNNRIALDFGDMRYDSALIDGTYPDYTRIIPENHADEITVSRVALISAINKIASIMDGKSRRISLSCAGEIVEVSGHGMSGEEAVDGIDCIATNSRDISFNSTYIVDALNNCSSDDVTLMLGNSEVSPVKIIDGNTTIIVMPMKGQ